MIYIFCFKWKPTGARRIPSQDIVTYGAEHVNKLYHMVRRNTTLEFEMILVSDEYDSEVDPNISQLKLWDEFRGLGGCYVRLKMFDDREGFREYLNVPPDARIVCMDLDMIITGNIDHILGRKEPFVFYKMGGQGRSDRQYRFNCGLFMLQYGARPFVYHKFQQNPGFWMKVCDYIPGSDQAWCNYILDLDKEAYWDKLDGIFDMRTDFIEKGITDLDHDSRIIMWPGPRDPSEAKWRDKYPWIDQYWR